jgi:ABC-type multidrug transport system ATPase subunit
MIEIEASQLSKKYNNNFVLKNFNHRFTKGGSFAIKGGNGIGKSTLIKMLCGFLSPSGGTVTYTDDVCVIGRNHIFKQISIAAPYCSIIQDYTLKENFDFLAKFKTLPADLDYKGLVDMLEWKDPRAKLVNQFSSGMQQKANVCFAFIAQSALLFLDEPTSYMDFDARQWYKNMFEKFTTERTTIVASNDDFDFSAVSTIIELGK